VVHQTYVVAIDNLLWTVWTWKCKFFNNSDSSSERLSFQLWN